MRQELAFLSHLTRLVGGEPSRATRPAPRRARRAGTPAVAPRPGPAGLAMPISSFYGLQTSLRGLLAQQRSLDIDGHNIANASTAGYSRQEAVLTAVARARRARRRRLRAAPARSSAPASTCRPTAASATASSTSSTARQNIGLGEQDGRAERLDRAELALAEPGEQRHHHAARRSSGTPGPTSPTRPSDPAARQALRRAGRGAGRRLRARSTASSRSSRATRPPSTPT